MMAGSQRGQAVARVIASGFGCGYAPVAPGTAGSLAGLALGWVLLMASPAALAAGTVLAACVGFWSVPLATGLTMRNRLKGPADDPGWVVIDEIAGQMVAMLGLSHAGPAGAVAAFVLFRLFDIAKPGPVGWLDRQGGAAGIMADDLLAGAMAGLVVYAARMIFIQGHG